MEPLYCVLVSIAAYAGEGGTGHAIITRTDEHGHRISEEVAIETDPIPAVEDPRMWASRAIAAALGEL